MRTRVLIRSAERANENIAIAESGKGDPHVWEEALVPERRLANHVLRDTFASWLVAEGEDPAYVMQQMGHTDPKMTLGLYAKALTSKRRRAQGRPQAGGQRAAVDTNLPAGAAPEEVLTDA